MTNPITNISRERLEALIDDEDCRATVEEQETLAAFMLAVMDAKPYGYVAESPCSSGYGGMMHEFSIERLDAQHDANEHDGFVIELYTTPPAPSVTDGWIKCSDRMPAARHEVLVGCYWGNGFAKKWATYIPGHPDAQSSGWLLPGASWTPTHWHELPAPPGAA